MTIFDVLEFIGGIAMLLFGINYMSSALEKKAGGQLSGLLSKFTSNKYMGFLLGVIVTAIIHSSGATTVMVVGFVNSGIMTLSRSVGVIMGANVGTTVTAWILSLTGIDGNSLIVNLLKPTSFSPILALIGVILYVFQKNGKNRDLGMILIGFSFLMFGMDRASDAVSALSDDPDFIKLFVLFKNPVLGMLAGAILTMLIQSSTASVGILQALCRTGQVSVSAAFPIILGQNIGTCITAMLSSVGANKNAKRAAMVHFNFNFLGSLLLMILFYGAKALFNFAFAEKFATEFDIAVIHTVCNIIVTAVFLPASSLIERLSCKMVRESKNSENDSEEVFLDERFFVNPAAALLLCRDKTQLMAEKAADSMKKAIGLLDNFDISTIDEIKQIEKKLDKYEDAINSYLVKLSSRDLTEKYGVVLAELLHVTSIFERLSDHAVHLSFYLRQLGESEMDFSDRAGEELSVITRAVSDVIDMTVDAFCKNDIQLASQVEPLEQVIDRLTAKAKNNHTNRMLINECSFEVGLIYSDVLTILERVSDHCSEISASIVEISRSNMGIHGYLKEFKKNDNPEFNNKYQQFKEKYSFN